MLDKLRAKRDPQKALRPEVLRELDLLIAGDSVDPEQVSFQDARDKTELFVRTYNHAFPFPLDRISALWRRCEDSGDVKERARRIAAILAAGLERLLTGRQEVEAALDSRENQSVTTDRPADGSARESDDLGN